MLLKYRAEIDGLRAIAVVPVILFHAGFDSFAGGYIGVDIFFVISGYLITALILREMENGTFSLVNFYERRARRILPALAFVVLVCLPFAWLWLPPKDLKAFAQSLVAVATFSSNILFWKQSGYFDTATELKPLIHTWSLAVEEQYYILFPLFLMVVWKFGKKVLVTSLLVVFLISILLGQWGAMNKPAAAFYLLPTRGWEILIGAFCAFYLQSRPLQRDPGPLDQLMSMIGLGLIGVAVVNFDSTTLMPGFIALIPTLGTGLIILFGTPRTYVGRFLSLPWLVGTGLISYSVYLWHQSLFAFARHRMLTEPEEWVFMVLAVFSIKLGYLSWWFIEKPFRNRNAMNRKTIFAFSFASMALLAVMGMVGIAKDGFLNPKLGLAPNVEWSSLGEKIQTEGEICDRRKLAGSKWLSGCYFGAEDGNRTVILYGDSHGQAISYALDEAFKKEKIRGLVIEVEGCELVPYFRLNRNLEVTDCEARFNELLALVHSLKADVIVASRWTFRLYPIEGESLEMLYRNRLGYVEKETYREYDVLIGGKFYRDAETKEKYLEKFLSALADASRTCFLLYPVPETAIDIERHNRFHFRKYGTVLKDLSIPYEDYLTRNQFILNVFDKLDLVNLKKVRVDEVFCNSFIDGSCAVQVNGVPFYYDDDHLSLRGAELVVQEILRLSDWKP